MAVFRSIIDRLVLRLTQSDMYESQFLRRYFKETYNINIGMYSIGCFDRWRIPVGTTIGRYCSIAASARLIDANHPVSALSTHPFFYAPELGLVSETRVRTVPPI